MSLKQLLRVITNALSLTVIEPEDEISQYLNNLSFDSIEKQVARVSIAFISYPLSNHETIFLQYDYKRFNRFH
jgi:hypothetical protein